MTEKLHEAVRILNSKVVEGTFRVSMMPILLDLTIEYQIPGTSITVWYGDMDSPVAAIVAMCWAKLEAIEILIGKDTISRNLSGSPA